MHANPVAPLSNTCPALYVLAVQGADQSSPDTPADLDTGVLGTLLRSVTAQAPGLVQRAYVPYQHLDIGTDAPAVTRDPDSSTATGATDSYAASITATLQRVDTMASSVIARCPRTLLAAAGYTDGAPVIAQFAHQAATGTGPVPPDRIAGVALFGDPGRPAGTTVLPGRPGQTTPDPAPGTTGTAVSAINLLDPHLPGTGGVAVPGAATVISTAPSEPADYEALSGRVAQFCVPGDVTCDKPAHGALLDVVANIARRGDFRDPVSAIGSIADALSATVINAGITIVGNDLSGTSLDTVDYQPQESIAQRLADASDPQAPQPGPNDAIAALFKLGTIAFNTVVSVVTDVFTPDTIAALATVGLADPVAALGILGTKLAGAVVQVVSPEMPVRLVDEAFQAIRDTVTDNSDLANLDMVAQYSSAIASQNTYGQVPATTTGQPPLAAAATWFAALAHDIASTRASFGTPAADFTTPVTASSAPTTTGFPAPSAPSPGATAVPPS
ncbi:cutinase family protein [Nocardia sp. alder85J]|uniref:cutinase family protein n=1 Tax=Nocardia sp. alder85J TaxID=2862949 RepID=UPI001CD2D9D2|nr:cutinase family protein [Nocardia sp. alder85J]MCX4098329.1 cutinase family protein [Nocardia sp. alder85J]